jgi:hypothetical protein
VTDPLFTAKHTIQLSGPRDTSDIVPPSGTDIINPAALAHLGERQTEALTSSHCEIHWILCILEVLCSIHRSGIQPSSLSPSSVAQLVARSAVMTARSKQPEGFWFDPRLRRMRSFLLPIPAIPTPVLWAGCLFEIGSCAHRSFPPESRRFLGTPPPNLHLRVMLLTMPAIAGQAMH